MLNGRAGQSEVIHTVSQLALPVALMALGRSVEVSLAQHVSFDNRRVLIAGPVQLVDYPEVGIIKRLHWNGRGKNYSLEIIPRGRCPFLPANAHLCNRLLTAPHGAYDKPSSRSRENAVIDTKQNFENTLLFSSIAGSNEILRGSTTKNLAPGTHPATNFCLIAEHFQSTFQIAKAFG